MESAQDSFAIRVNMYGNRFIVKGFVEIPVPVEVVIPILDMRSFGI